MSSDPTELQSMALSIRKDIITTSESTDRSFSQVITMPDIQSDVKKLHAGKSGGVSAVTSDSFTHGIDSLYAFIAMLFNAMLLHGTLPNDFWCLFNTDTKGATSGCTENPKLPYNCTEQYSW